jgi:maltose alpha-D-glucosyltransferase/alpha-amylase
VQEAHDRGLRVITELIMNHTSDQHPLVPGGAPARRRARLKRDYYVWSDDPNKYAGTRIIFTDTESSNWAWDPVAQQHYLAPLLQPPAGPELRQPARGCARCLKTMHFWLDMGVDGFRLDAIPYLVEREGTSQREHARDARRHQQIRADLDRATPGKMLLAEANMWPEDVRQYFGDGDECHMAYHFPMMPRPVHVDRDGGPLSRWSEIMAQTPTIPANCQWAIFLRNHDELTLEMVTDRERDYMYRIFADDPAHARERRHPPPPRPAHGEQPAEDRAPHVPPHDDAGRADPLLRRRDRHGRTTSTSATATACGLPCSGRRIATRASRARTRSACISLPSWTRCTATRW